MKFNKNSNKLFFSSRWKKGAVKIADLKDMCVLKDFPNNQYNVKFAFCGDFSLNDEYLSIGNDEGNVLLYKTNY